MTNQNRAKEVAIKIDSVSKDFNLPHEVDNNLKQKLLHPLKRNSTEKQHALKDISFNINKGDFFGIVGRNGSGKSTLLKIIAEIYTPTKGNVTVNGSLTPFIELGVGFNPELTGRENVYLNGAMLGFSKKEVRKMYAEIVEFAELEKFMDQKLKNYSSGMQVRLAFSVAIRAKSDILLLDEVLAVGDSVFQQKCFEYFYELKKNKKTVVFVSHDMESVKKYCTRSLLIRNSKVVKIGTPTEVANEYLIDAGNAISIQKDKKAGVNKTKDNLKQYVDVINTKLITQPNIKRSEPTIKISLDFTPRKDFKGMPALSIHRTNEPMSVAEVNYGKILDYQKNKKVSYEFTCKLNDLNGGNYSISFCLLGKDGVLLSSNANTLNINIEDSEATFGGVLKLDNGWKKK